MFIFSKQREFLESLFLTNTVSKLSFFKESTINLTTNSIIWHNCNENRWKEKLEEKAQGTRYWRGSIRPQNQGYVMKLWSVWTVPTPRVGA